MLSDMLSILAVMFMGLPVIAVIYYNRRKHYMRKYFGEEMHVEQEIYGRSSGSVVSAGSSHGWQGMTENGEKAQADKVKKIQDDWRENSLAGTGPRNEEVTAEMMNEGALSEAEEEPVSEMAAVEGTKDEEMREHEKNEPENIEQVQQTDADYGRAGKAVQSEPAAVNDEKRKKKTIPLLVKLALIGFVLYEAVSGWMQYNKASQQLKQIEDLKAVQAEDTGAVLNETAASLPQNKEVVMPGADTEKEVMTKKEATPVEVPKEPVEEVNRNEESHYSEPEKTVEKPVTDIPVKEGSKPERKLPAAGTVRINRTTYVYKKNPDGYFSNLAKDAQRTANYFSVGRSVNFDNAQGGFLHLRYTDNDGKENEGWIKKSDTDYPAE